MAATSCKKLIVILLAFTTVSINSIAQEYVSPTKAPEKGKAPGLKSKIISENKQSVTYMLVFAKGDEVISGLTDFAEKNQIKSASFTAIGSAQSSKFGWYDKEKKMFKVIPVDKQSEITSLIGDIASYQNKPVVHTHITLGMDDGSIKGGHLLEAHVWPTLEVTMTVHKQELYKKLDQEVGVTTIDLDAKQ
ncbi:DUF296 domain-containing protein [Pedobacter sp. HMF7647]|uniref:DUF296 domain-containing protein n=1 Tax=Hufsiella arboris TaxID=2695275 RepID=A0A7K1Y8I5_9SPHI|nr:PPC domain-containing DNA-binding protein [Hufsiella arboris]MXV50887.1 DUF296 domain-containing protein [Hufsiella arboris]